MVKRSVRALAGVVGAALVCVLVVVAPASARHDADAAGKHATSSGNYIVQMAEPPAVAYEGGTAGLKATAATKGKKIDPASPDVVAYAAHLNGKHDEALAAVGGAQKLYDYDYSLDGFAAALTGAQAEKLRSLPGVVAVEKDVVTTIDTSTTPTFLGLDAENGLWSKLGGVGSAGENVIIGELDTGVWPESPSFSDRTGSNQNGVDGKLAYQQIPGWHGKCTPGEDFNASNCNQKLIGAQYFHAGSTVIPEEFMSPRDFDGHGSHTSSTAGGNNGILATGPTEIFGKISGMAPRARIAMYKVCWEKADHSTAGCSSLDQVAAVDQAVADGVDVINMSVGGSQTSFLSATEVAFLFAARAGVFVTVSAGNSGPGASTVEHPSPWIMTTAAGTHPRGTRGSVSFGTPTQTFFGASVSDRSVTAQVVRSVDVGTAGANATLVRQCWSGANLDPAKVAGRIVQCDRGGNARTDKSLAVMQAGGVGMVLTNTPTSAQGLNGDFHFVPSVHVGPAARAALFAYIASAGAGATATVSKAEFITVPAPALADFSSRGPILASSDIIKPDIEAPGVDVLASVAPPNHAGRQFDLESGTSMASPHIAGIAADLIQLHPDWTPDMIKSALQTTAGNVLDDSNPFDVGAGHVNPNGAADPGVVYKNGYRDWLRFLCGTGQLTGSTCAAVGSIDPSDLNLASIAIGELAGKQTVTRTVTSVSGATESYTAAASVPGIKVDVSPSSFTLAPGASKAISITFTRDTATMDEYATGFFTLTSSKHVARSPVAIRPVSLAAPAEKAGTVAAGGTSWNVTTGYAGTLTFAARGLVPAATASGTIAQDPAASFSTTGQGISTQTVSVPAGTAYARFSIFDTDTTASDLDLYVFDAAGNQVGASGGPTASEEVDLEAPAAGTYTVYVHGFSVPGGTAPYKLYSWAVGGSAGNFTVPAAAATTVGGTVPVTLTWSGLTAGTKYLGAVEYGNGTSTIGRTLVRVDG